MSASFHFPTFSIEQDLLKEGYRYIAGVDEAGRGALAGPLSLGMVIYSSSIIEHPDEEILSGINDSKKLTPKKRDTAYDLIRNRSLAETGTMVSHKIVDVHNVNGATEYTLNKIIQNIDPKPDIILMDGNFTFNIGIPMISIKKGDSKSLTIASASIIAKVTRDRIMDKMDAIYPNYGFSRNKGYGTKEHMQSIYEYGYVPIHRKSFEPVKSIVERNQVYEN